MKNKYSTWSKPPTELPPPDGHGEFSAAQRIVSNGYLKVGHNPKFTLKRSDAVYTVGSCFATNISTSLSRMGMNVLNDVMKLDCKYFTEDKFADSIALIKFTPHSFLNELQTNLPGSSLEGQNLIEISSGKFWNPQLHKIKPTSLDENVEIQQIIKKNTNHIYESDVVFLTLGLTETWFDKATNIALNENPLRIKELRKKEFKDRFEFHNLDFVEALRTTEEAIALVREHGKKDVKFILTVSPIPLLRTFQDMDIIVANSLSKSTLRGVADEIQRKYDWVDYFPSYEMVTNSPRNLAWFHDQRHVNQDMVDHVIKYFVDTYFPND